MATAGFIPPQMICRHGAGDPNCSKNGGGYSYSAPEPKTPDSAKFEIVEIEQVGNHIVMKVLYPNCSSCAYEGNKVMVYLNVTLKEVIKWRKIDPHFRKTARTVKDAPSPAARFPASPEGWSDAMEYAQRKARQ